MAEVEECHTRESEFCIKKCKDRICGKIPIVHHILLSEDNRKIQWLVDVFAEYELVIADYV